MTHFVCPVVGTKFCKGSGPLLARASGTGLPLGMALVYRDFDNRYDRHAVAVSVDGDRVGFIPSTQAARAGREMDAAGEPSLPAQVSSDGRGAYNVTFDVPGGRR